MWREWRGGSGTVERDGLVFDVTTAGPADGEPVVLLHGFPQSARCWEAVTPALAAAGLRTFAPDQRGYSPGARPVGRAAYRMAEVVADAAAVVEAALAETGRSRAHVVGHDWGAIVAWTLAGDPARARPHRHRDLRAARRRAMADALRRPRQLLASWYMAAFAVPGLAERVFAVPRGASWSPALVRAARRVRPDPASAPSATPPASPTRPRSPRR